MASLRITDPEALAERSTLERLLGPVADITREPITVPGFTGARFERLGVRLDDGSARSLILKRARLDADWSAWRTGDTFGRATLPLAEPALAGIWQVYASPYLAHAAGAGEVGLLMQDLAPSLLPDVRAPLEEPAERSLLDALARLHARFWDADALVDPRLVTAGGLIGLLGPRLATELGGRTGSTPVIGRAQQGWEVAFRHLPARVSARLLEPPVEIVRAWGPLPRTLLHGDVKVANFALLPDGRVAAFDWGLIAAGPPAIDLGWYLAVNATRIRGSKEALLALYRSRLEAALARALPETTWSALVNAAIEAGAMLLLWSKALALERGDAASRAEWEWWLERLSAV